MSQGSHFGETIVQEKIKTRLTLLVFNAMIKAPRRLSDNVAFFEIRVAQSGRYCVFLCQNLNENFLVEWTARNDFQPTVLDLNF
jgi:hypothetical protein